MAPDCEINYNAAGQFEGCVEIDDGPPECILDCPDLEDIGPDASPDILCEWIISINGSECIEDCEEELIIGFEYLTEACYNCLSDEDADCADVFEDNDGEDDGGFAGICSDINNPEECYDVGCEWSTVTTPNGIFEMCVDPGFSDDGGWNEDGCFEDGEWYCYGCELFINDCEYYECTENGWVGPLENSDCNDNGDDGGEEDGPPECLLDCEGIEYIDPSEDAYETCDWIISNFGPNNFFAECAEDCDGETMEVINQLVEACYECLSNENFDCADVFDDEDENSCLGLSQDDCESLDYCEWIPDSSNFEEGQCVEAGPSGDDGGTGGGDGCLDNAGDWYCYGCESWVNECEYYECTENGWTGPFIIDNCWEGCAGLSINECIDVPNCVWVFAEDNPNTPYGYCMESDDNPPTDDLAILKLGHTTAVPGSTISVPLILDNLETIGGLQFSMGGYNTPNFPGVSVEWFESTNDCFSASYNEIDGELIGIIFSLEGCSYPPSDYNHIADILFYIDDSAPVGVDIPLWFNYTLVSDTSGNEIPSHGEDSFITLGMQGDVNFDGVVNILDIVTVVNFAIYIDEPNDSELWASDINNDGQINILDIVQLINIILGR